MCWMATGGGQWRWAPRGDGGGDLTRSCRVPAASITWRRQALSAMAGPAGRRHREPRPHRPGACGPAHRVGRRGTCPTPTPEGAGWWRGLWAHRIA
jgi:hypothetical protein